MNITEETSKELKRCIEEPWYFYNKYVKIEGVENKREITKEEWEQMLTSQQNPHITKLKDTSNNKIYQQLLHNTIFTKHNI